MNPAIPDDEFWLFSLSFYAAPGVSKAYLALQDDAGVDVNVLLFILWCAATGRELDAASIAAADIAVTAWRENVIKPLRVIRRATKIDLLSGESVDDFRNKLKGLELDAEHVAQSALFAGAPQATYAEEKQPAARKSFAVYAKRLGQPLPDGPVCFLLEALERWPTQ
jgi:uncharacterized protein (TIGR02444 family)